VGASLRSSREEQTGDSDLASDATPMRLIFLSHGNNLNGAERCLAEAVRGLTYEGHEVGVVVPSEGDLAPVLRGFGATVVIVPHRWWVHDDGRTQLTLRQKAENFAHYLVDANKISRVIRGMNAQLLITNTITIPTGALAAKFCGIPHIWYFHEFGDKDHNLIFDLGRRFSFWFINHTSAKVIVNSQSVYRHFRKYISSTKLSLIYYSVDVTLPQAQASLPVGFNVVMVATVAPGKRQHEAIEAVRILRGKGLNIQLTLVGGQNPAYTTYIREQIKNHNLCDAVHMLGHSYRPLSYLSAADAVLVCSSNEAFGRVTVEAMKLSKPVIAANAGGTHELIQDGLTGLFYQSGNAEELAEKIEYLYDHPELRIKFGEKGRGWAFNTFTIENYISGLLEVINQAIEL
jgi:glycosyltransferase involved in cell wall biosynthesis